MVGLLAALLACAPRTSGPPPGGSGILEWAGLRLEVELLPSPADRLRARAVLRNTSDHFLAREVPHCVLRLRLYRGGSLIWDQGEEEACVGVRIVRLAPGERRSFWTSVRSRRILRGEHPEGEYLVRAFWPARSPAPGRPPRAAMEITVGVVRLSGG